MRKQHNKTTPKVKAGKVQRKNRASLTPNYHTHAMPHLVIDKRPPGRGYRHLVRKHDIQRFIGLLPDWDELSQGLNAIVLAPGNDGAMGWHKRGVVAICAWERAISLEGTVPEFYTAHKKLLQKLGVPCHRTGGVYHLGFNELTARAFSLIHIFVHELGHHHDRITTRSRKQPARGESYAEGYAKRYENLIVERYRPGFEL